VGCFLPVLLGMWRVRSSGGGDLIRKSVGC